MRTITALLLASLALLVGCSATTDQLAEPDVRRDEPATSPTAVVSVPTATVETPGLAEITEPVEVPATAVVPPANDADPMSAPEIYEGRDPAVFTVGRAVGVTPDRNALIVVDTHPNATASCEGDPALAFWRQPFGGSARSLISEREVLNGGVAHWSVFDGRVLWMEFCDGLPIGPFVASIEPNGMLGEATRLIIESTSDNPWETSYLPRWIENGTIEVGLDGSDTVLIVDSRTGAVIETVENSDSSVFDTWGWWDFDTQSQKWMFTVGRVALSVPGLGPDARLYANPVIDDKLGLAFLTVPSNGPSWTQVLAVPLNDESSVRSVLAPSTPLIGEWTTAFEPLAPLRNGVEWLVQIIDPADECVADLVVTSLDGTSERQVIQGRMQPISNIALQDERVAFISGCGSGPWTLNRAVLSSDTFDVQATSSVGFVYPLYLYDVVFADGLVRSGHASDSTLELDTATGSVRIEGDSSIMLQLAAAELQVPLPGGWSADTVGESLLLNHPSGAAITVTDTANPPRPDTSPSAVAGDTYNFETADSLPTPVAGELWRSSS